MTYKSRRFYFMWVKLFEMWRVVRLNIFEKYDQKMKERQRKLQAAKASLKIVTYMMRQAKRYGPTREDRIQRITKRGLTLHSQFVQSQLKSDSAELIRSFLQFQMRNKQFNKKIN